jgi:hypothetical protein
MVTGYVEDNTQEGRILSLLRDRGERGAYVYEFMMPRPQGLGIAQYNAEYLDYERRDTLSTTKHQDTSY